MVYVLALAASLANALTGVFQRIGVQDAPADATLKLSLMTHALRRGTWLAGFGLMIVSFLLQATALHLGRLSQVQPILATELVFLVAVLAFWSRFTIGPREWLGTIAVSIGLAGFLYFANPRDGMRPPPSWRWGVAGGICVVVIVAAVALALRGPRWWRAAMFGTAAAVSFAFTAACTKVVSDYATWNWLLLYRHWQTYALALFGTLGIFLTQNAIHAGPLVASQSTLVLADPLASILIGVGLFGDNLRTGGISGPLEAVSLLIAFTGTLLLAQSPLISAMKDGSEQIELLVRRTRTAPVVSADTPAVSGDR
ncbi:MAG TPA: DMT family transporter [Streptosporangiaceae bacterium]|nr:DMT family transporter [Streptosporangiaceae bacterium]